MRILAALALVSLTGCATVSSWFSSPASAPYIQAAVLIAVSTAEAKGVSAAQINTIAKAAFAADTDVPTTLSAVGALLDSQIAKLKLPAGDQAAADILVAALEAAIAVKVGTNTSIANAQAAVGVVLTDVIAAT